MPQPAPLANGHLLQEPSHGQFNQPYSGPAVILKAGVALDPGLNVMIDSADVTQVQLQTDAGRERNIGIVLGRVLNGHLDTTQSAAANEDVAIAVGPCLVDVRLGATLSAGDVIGPHASNGRMIAHVQGAEFSGFLYEGGAAGDLAKAFIVPTNVRGLSASELVLAEGNVLVGNASGDAAPLDASGDTQILVGNGTTITSVAVSGDGTLANDGTFSLADYSTEGLKAHRIARAVYDFSVDGGSVGAIGLGVTLPDNAIVTRAWYHVVTTFTSPTGPDNATVALGITSDDATGIVAALAINDVSNIWDAGNHEGIQDGAVSNFSTQTTAARELILTVGVEDLTAGKLILFCEYVITE